MRPRCCLRYFTFFGINIAESSGLEGREGQDRQEGCFPFPPFLPFLPLLPNLLASFCSGRPSRSPLPVFLFTTAQRHETLALVQPDLDSNLSVGRVRFRETKIDVRAQCLQRKLP